MPWKIFDRDAGRYEDWYASPRGRRVSRAEEEMLRRLAAQLPSARTAVEVGCGTGHFTRAIRRMGLRTAGLDRAPAMLEVMRSRAPEIPLVLGDGHDLPFRTGAVDLVFLITTLEFLDDPATALREAVRVARQGLVLIVLNRCSVGGLSRRWGRQARGSLLSAACDYSLPSLRRLLERAGGAQVEETSWASTLFPDGLWRVSARVALGDVLGLAVRLRKRNGRAAFTASTGGRRRDR